MAMRINRRQALAGMSGAGAALATGVTGFPAISRAQSDVIKIGHLTPRTGFLGVLGDYAVMAADQAADEINTAGGVLGRKIELLKEDSVNPQTASTKAERMIERDKVACIVGEISSASCLAIAQVAQRTKNLFVNTGGNSDALRGSNCNRVHVPRREPELDVREDGRALAAGRQHGQGQEVVLAHRRLCVRPRSVAGRQAVHGSRTADSSPPTSWCRRTSPTSRACCTKIRNSKPDLVVSNLAGNQITNFLKQYSEFGLDFPVAGFGFDTAVAWGAGKGNFFGTWPLVWHHLIDTAGLQEIRGGLHGPLQEAAREPGLGRLHRAQDPHQGDERREVDRGRARSSNTWRRSPSSTCSRRARATSASTDHQLMHEMYAVEALKANELKNQWDIYRPSAPVPAAERAA